MDQVILLIAGGGIGLIVKILFDWLKNVKGASTCESKDSSTLPGSSIEYEKRLTVLETQREIKDTQVIEQNKRIEDRLDKIFDWLQGLPCERHGERINHLEGAIK